MKIRRTQVMLFSFFAILLATISISQSTFAKTPVVVKHIVLEDETAWFLAHVYYGSGKQYPKLLAANKLSRPEEIKEGMEIQIESPKYFKEQSDFSKRYADLWQVRQKALGLKNGSPLPNAKVVISTETIRNQDSLPQLPFTEVRAAGHHGD